MFTLTLGTNMKKDGSTSAQWFQENCIQSLCEEEKSSRGNLILLQLTKLEGITTIL